MDRYLRASILCFIFSGIIFYLLLMTGCGPEWKLLCRHNSIAAMHRVSEELPTRMGFSDNHMQAEAFWNGEWRPVCADGDFVRLCKAEHDPIYYLTPTEVWKVFGLKAQAGRK